MKAFFRSIAQALRDSVLARLGLAMGTLALLSFVSIVMSTVIADNVSGKASAINISGSLRMMSFRTLSELQQPDKRQQAAETAEQFERRMLGLERFVRSKAAGNAPLLEAMSVVVERWQSLIRPIVRAAVDGQADALAQAAQEIPGFVAQIDKLVLLIEEDLERKVTLLRATQFALLAIIVLVSLVTTWMLRRQLVQPLAQLVGAARTVSQGSFSVRVQHTGGDELGQLGHAFNTMVGEIATMYAHLEDKVEEKTQELTRTNQSLELLYRTSQRLAASDLGLDTLREVLRDIENALDLGHSMICLSETGTLPAHPLIGDLDPAELARLCDGEGCAHCFGNARRPLAAQAAAGEPVLFLPVEDGDHLHGALPIFLRSGQPLPPDKARIVETVGHHVTNALANMRRAEEKHRLAVLEERSAIARELHDSIAQSLSYLKIQVTRLEKHLAAGDEATAIAGELKAGLNAAYAELRELIATFRLRVDTRGFASALADTIAEFRNRLGFAIDLDNGLAGLALSANEEMHVLRVIREALSNIERHAGARSAAVDICVEADYSVCVVVRDDGRGFDPAAIPPNHFGTSIMHDRAQILGGRLDIDSVPGQGCTIRLCFRPQKFAAPAA